jgi:hypothetical protein
VPRSSFATTRTWPPSAGRLFDLTEIDEILTLRVLTMTDAEKAEARPTDPRAAADAVDVHGVKIARDSLVVLRPARRPHAQDLFLDGRLAKVTAVVSDVGGGTHVAVALTGDPDADLHEWHGRHYYFAPDEIEPATEGGDRS